MRKKVIFRLVGGGIQVEEINHILFVESNGHVQQVHRRWLHAGNAPVPAGHAADL